MILIKIVLFFLLYTFLFILGLILLAILSPIKGYVSFKGHKIFAKGSYFFGIIKIVYDEKQLTIRLLGIKLSTTHLKNKNKSDDINNEELIDENKEEEKEKKTSEKKESKRKLPSKRIVVLALKLIKKLIKIIAPNEMSLQLTLGLDDPYYTGIFGLIYDVVFIPLNIPKDYHFVFIPVYDDLALAYEGHARINFSMMKLIVPCVSFIFKKPIRDYHEWFKFKKKDAN